MLQNPFPDFLPGKFLLQRGSARDYHALSMFHYVAKRPATWADVWVVRFIPRRDSCAIGSAKPRTVAIGVLSYPVPSCRPRERFLGLSPSRNRNLCFANAHLRTISRVIVHPQFRSLGLSTVLVRSLCDHCQTRYVEAIAAMGRVHPLFERAGMTRVEAGYYILDRTPSLPLPVLRERDGERVPPFRSFNDNNDVPDFGATRLPTVSYRADEALRR